MILSENAGTTPLEGGVLVAAGGPADPLASLPPGKPLAVGSIPVPPSKAGTLVLKYGPGTVPHQVQVRVADVVNPWLRRITLNITGPGEYTVEHRVTRIFSLTTTVDPQGPLTVGYQWRAVLAKEGAPGLLGALDKNHPTRGTGGELFVRCIEQASVKFNPVHPVEWGKPIVADKNGHGRSRQDGDEGDILGTFVGLEGSETAPLAIVSCRVRRG